MGKYDEMPLCYIHDVKIQADQLGKRIAKECLSRIAFLSDHYSLDPEYVLSQVKKNLNSN